jgi:two-component system OmpR family sensor kinase
MIGRRLFWRIYLTLFASLALTAVLMALLWSAVGDTRVEGLRKLPSKLIAAAIPELDEPPGAIQAATARVAAAMSGDLTVIGADGQLLAVSGERLRRGTVSEDDDWDRPPAPNVPASNIRVFRLPDGRVVLARFDFPLRRPAWHVFGALLVVAFGVAMAALPVVARLTHRLERLQRGMERWGNGNLGLRVPVRGHDEIASVAASFNRAADRIQALLAAHRSLLANASHELRSPLARLSMAAELWEQSPSPARRSEIERNLAELDQLIDEILLASRLEHTQSSGLADADREPVDLLALAAEEAARTGATVDGAVVEVAGDARQLRRMLRNLLENAGKHGAPPVEVDVSRIEPNRARIEVRDAGQQIPAGERERIFEPFYRPTGRSEGTGGWGLGLALVRQIVLLHGGTVRCEAATEGGTAFIVELPAAA